MRARIVSSLIAGLTGAGVAATADGGGEAGAGAGASGVEAGVAAAAVDVDGAAPTATFDPDTRDVGAGAVATGVVDDGTDVVAAEKPGCGVTAAATSTGRDGAAGVGAGVGVGVGAGVCAGTDWTTGLGGANATPG